MITCVHLPISNGTNSKMSDYISLLVSITTIITNITIIVSIRYLAKQTKSSLIATQEAELLRVAEIYRSINLQFDSIISALPPQINDFPTLKMLRHYATQPGFTPGEAEKAIWRYYEMVRMEFELCRMGVITDQMWCGWLKGIISSFRYPAFCEIWNRLNDVDNSKPLLMKHSAFSEFMRMAQQEPENLLQQCSTVKTLKLWVEGYE